MQWTAIMMQEEAICKREYPWECTKAIFQVIDAIGCTEAVCKL